MSLVTSLVTKKNFWILFPKITVGDIPEMLSIKVKFILLPLYSLIPYRSALYRLVPIILNLDLNRTLPYQLSPLPKQRFLTPTPLTRPHTCPVLIEMSPHATTFHHFCFDELQFIIKFTICIWNIFF